MEQLRQYATGCYRVWEIDCEWRRGARKLSQTRGLIGHPEMRQLGYTRSMRVAEDRRPNVLRLYEAIGSSFTAGFARVILAENYSLALIIASHGKQLPYQDSSAGLFDRPSRERCFEYVSKTGLMIYSATLFENFIADTTRLLLLANPGAIGSNCLVPIGTVLSDESRMEVIDREVTKKLRTLSFSTIEERFEFLRNRFGLKFDLSELMGRLKRLTELRNELVHDQSCVRFSFEVVQNGSSESWRDPKAPTEEILELDSTEVYITYYAAGLIVYRSVVCDFLNSDVGSPWHKTLEELLQRLRKCENVPTSV
jgi:hypothetical protein